MTNYSASWDLWFIDVELKMFLNIFNSCVNFNVNGHYNLSLVHVQSKALVGGWFHDTSDSPPSKR